jgi:hypothetical protein
MLTGFGMHARLGFLVAIAMAVSCLAAIVILPAMVYAIRPGFVFRAGLPGSRTIETLSPPVTPAAGQP